MKELRTIYFIRHGYPDFLPDEKWCIGRTDRPLGQLGKMQGYLTGKALADHVPGGVFCSTLQRAVATALYLSPSPVTVPGLEECDAGEWDGLSFREIQEKYPELYKKRGTDRTVLIPGEENLYAVEQRFRSAVTEILDKTHGDIAVVSHVTAIGCFLAALSEESPENARNYRLPYGGWIKVQYDSKKFFMEDCFKQETVEKARPEMNPELCLELQSAAELSERICLHCGAVAREAIRIADEVNKATGLVLNRNLIMCAALLHDVARLEKHHEVVGGKYLSLLGYPEVGNLIAQHDGPDEMKINEAAVVYIADKQICQETRVTVEERYAGSRAKCITPEALERHALKKAQALEMKKLINTVCGKEIIL